MKKGQLVGSTRKYLLRYDHTIATGTVVYILERVGLPTLQTGVWWDPQQKKGWCCDCSGLLKAMLTSCKHVRAARSILEPRPGYG